MSKIGRGAYVQNASNTQRHQIGQTQPKKSNLRPARREKSAHDYQSARASASDKSPHALSRFQADLEKARPSGPKWAKVVAERAATVTKIEIQNSRNALYGALADVYAAYLDLAKMKREARRAALKALGSNVGRSSAKGPRYGGIRALLLAMTDHSRSNSAANAKALQRDTNAIEFAAKKGVKPVDFVKEISGAGAGVEIWARANREGKTDVKSLGKAPTRLKSQGTARSESSQTKTAEKARSLRTNSTKRIVKSSRSARLQMCRRGYFVALIKNETGVPWTRTIKRAAFISAVTPSAELWRDVVNLVS